MKPVTVAVNMGFVEVTELVKGMVFQIVCDDLILLGRLRLISESISSHNTRAFKWNVVGRIVTGTRLE